jgi:hypothetical protein
MHWLEAIILTIMAIAAMCGTVAFGALIIFIGCGPPTPVATMTRRELHEPQQRSIEI